VPTAIIGQTYTFNTLFRDAANNPITITGPTAKVFRFNSAGAEVVVASGSMTAVVGDSGRYGYTFTVPTSLAAGDTLFAVMAGTDPGTSDLLVANDTVDIIYNPLEAGGLNSRFIR